LNNCWLGIFEILTLKKRKT